LIDLASKPKLATKNTWRYSNENAELGVSGTVWRKRHKHFECIYVYIVWMPRAEIASKQAVYTLGLLHDSGW
jgi:hypothetical protein